MDKDGELKMKFSKIIKHFLRGLIVIGILGGIGYMMHLFIRQCCHTIPALINELTMTNIPIDMQLQPSDMAVVFILIIFGGAIFIFSVMLFIEWVFRD